MLSTPHKPLLIAIVERSSPDWLPLTVGLSSCIVGFLVYMRVDGIGDARDFLSTQQGARLGF